MVNQTPQHGLHTSAVHQCRDDCGDCAADSVNIYCSACISCWYLGGCLVRGISVYLLQVVCHCNLLNSGKSAVCPHHVQLGFGAVLAYAA